MFANIELATSGNPGIVTLVLDFLVPAIAVILAGLYASTSIVVSVGVNISNSSSGLLNCKLIL